MKSVSAPGGRDLRGLMDSGAGSAAPGSGGAVQLSKNQGWVLGADQKSDPEQGDDDCDSDDVKVVHAATDADWARRKGLW